MTSAAFIALLALAFTIGSFWWLNARQGSLRAFEPHTFAGAFSRNISIRIPLILFNDGAKPIVVQDLRMRLLDQPDMLFPLPWRNTRNRFMPGKGDLRDLPSVFVVEGRKATELIIDFGTPFKEFDIALREQRVEIEARLGHQADWMPLLSFVLHLENVTEPDIYIAYSNSDKAISPGDQAAIDRHLRALVDDLSSQGSPEDESGSKQS
ncbi:hypothetical protein AB0M44_38095 [Streptosporangium subroseum]|uniref:hypothetical protein n=1 Tax=Streptosporangium subroseum TaxID=106412 RepID=UPI0034483C91